MKLSSIIYHDCLYCVNTLKLVFEIIVCHHAVMQLITPSYCQVVVEDCPSRVLLRSEKEAI